MFFLANSKTKFDVCFDKAVLLTVFKIIFNTLEGFHHDLSSFFLYSKHIQSFQNFFTAHIL